MNDKKKLLKPLVIFGFLFLILNTAAVSAIAPPPPPGGRIYTVKGYVKSESGQPLNAKVKLYMDSIDYIATTYSSSSTGYFSFRTSQAHPPDRYWQVRVTKLNYQEKRVTDYDGIITNFGTINLVYVPPSPPAEPVIDQVHVTGQGIGYNYEVEFDVTWDSPSSQYDMKFYWSKDSTINEDDLWDIQIDGATHYDEISLPMTWIDSKYWFQIEARSKNTGGWSSTEIYGPQAVELKFYPTDDATIDQSQPESNLNTGELVVESDWTGIDPVYKDSILKFTIPNSCSVKSAVLKLWCQSHSQDGTDFIRAYPMTSSNWLEESVIWNTFQSHPVDQTESPLDSELTSTAWDWDVWDVTRAVKASGELAICLLPGTEMNEIVGSTYYSKDSTDPERWPHLVVEYWGLPETPVAPSGFISDTFSNSFDANWDISVYNDPPFDYWFGDDTSDIEDGGSLRFYGTIFGDAPSQTGWDFVQDSFYAENEFHYRSKVRFFSDSIMNTRAYLDLGIQLKNSNGDSIAWVKHTREPDFFGIRACVGSQSEDYSLSSLVEIYDGYFELLRYFSSDSQWRIKISWRQSDSFDSEVLIDELASSSAVTHMRLWCYAWDDSLYESEVHAHIDSVKEITMNRFSLWSDEDNTLNDFHEPIKNDAFNYVDEQTGYPANWFDADGSNPEAVRSSTEYYSSGYSCHADTTSSSWTITQEIEDSPTVDFNAVRGNPIGFTFWAGHSINDAQIRAVIQYWTSSRPTCPAVVTGDWFEIPKNGWTQVSVRTFHPIPTGVERIKVIVQGITERATLEFDAYIDSASFYFLVDGVSPPELSYSDYLGDGERGYISIAMMVYDIEATTPLSGITTYEIKMLPVIIVEALAGYAVRSIELGWSVSGDTAVNSANVQTVDGDDDIERGGVVETNDKNYFEQINDFEEWNSFVGWANHPLAKLGVSLAVGLVLWRAGVSYPASTIISSAVTQTIYAGLQPQISGVTDFSASVGDSAWGRILYPGETEDNLVHFVTQNVGPVTWTVVGELLAAMPTLEFHVRATFAANEILWPFPPSPSFIAYASASLSFNQFYNP